jgi:hypothetical protein
LKLQEGLQERLWPVIITFENVKDYLLKHFVPELSLATQELTRAWIDATGPADESDLLATNMAIDLKSGSLLSSHFEPIFKEIIYPFNSPRKAFDLAIEHCSTNIVLRMQCRHKTENTEVPQPTYVNVLDLTSFLQHYIIPSHPDLTPDDLERAKFRFFGDTSDAGTPDDYSLEEVTGTFAGPDGLVWVGPDAIYRQRTNDLDHNAATLLHNILGLGTCRGEMVYIRYPPGFKPKDCVQPTSLDHRHAGGCYLSASEGDFWGRTHCRAGSGDPVPERIHGQLVGLSVEFVARLLARPEVVPRNVDALRAESLRRFSAIK